MKPPPAGLPLEPAPPFRPEPLAQDAASLPRAHDAPAVQWVRAHPGVAVIAAFTLLGSTWNLPCIDTWASDSVSPRVSGLGSGLVETYAPGSFFTYPPLHLALLAVLQAPVYLVSAAVAGLRGVRLIDFLREPFAMTAFEVVARCATFAMAVFAVLIVQRTTARAFGRRAGVMAGLLLATNPTWVYYAHTGNLDVPYLFWATATLSCLTAAPETTTDLPPDVAGLARSGPLEALRARLQDPAARVFWFAAAAALTKDQAIALLLLPLGAHAAFASQNRQTRTRLLRACALPAGAFALVSGMIVNPKGWWARQKYLTGPASQDWTPYANSWAGRRALLHDLVAGMASPHALLLATLAIVGVLTFVRTRPSGRRVGIGMFSWLLATLSFFVFFTWGARRLDERFVIPLVLPLIPFMAYGSTHVIELIERAMQRPRLPRLAQLLFLAVLLPGAWRSLAVDFTLLGDARTQAGRALSRLPAGKRLRVYGANPDLPYLPDNLVTSRDGPEERSDPHPRIASEMHVLLADPETLDELVVTSHEAERYAPDGRPSTKMTARWASDPRASQFYAALRDDRLAGWHRTQRFACRLPWGERCLAIHGSTGEEIWLFEPNPKSAEE